MEAKKICRDFYDMTNPTEGDRFLFIEAMEFLIRETKNSNYMVDLGAEYYGIKRFDLALKYYEMAAESGNLYAISNLGYIWYYGRTGERDYEKAFRYFDKARQMGDLIAAYKVADMYRNGYFVEKNYEKYKQIIEELYPKVKKLRRLGDPVPEVFTRLARIRTEEGKTEEALDLYDRARDFLEQRIQMNPFFGNLNIMKWMIEDIYGLREFNPEYFELYDLYVLLDKPVRVSFFFEETQYEVEAMNEGDEVVIKFGDKWFRTADDFFAKAEINGELLTTLYNELYDFEVIDNE